MSIRFSAHACIRRSLVIALPVFSAVCLAAVDVPIPDPGFGGNGDGIVRVPFDVVANGSDVASAAVVTDGKLVLAGAAQVGADSYDIAFTRLGADGRLDTDFGSDGHVLAGLAPIHRHSGFDLARTVDGHLLYVARTSEPGAVAVVGRRNADGTADATFGGSGHRFLGADFFVDGGTDIELSRVIPRVDGKILVLGIAGVSTTGHACQAVARLLASGATDTGFGGGRGNVCVAPALAVGADAAYANDGIVLADGRILLAGFARHAGGSGCDMSVTRLLPDGELDTGFGPGHDGFAYVGFDQGGTLADAAYALAVDASGRIVIAGFVEQQAGWNIGVARLLPTGDVDPSFGLDGRRQFDFGFGGVAPLGVRVLADGRILVGGQFYDNAAGLALMLTPDGQLDPRFGDGGLFRQAAAGAPTSAVVATQSVMLDGDYLYMVGSNRDTAGDDFDFAATRVVLPLFRDGFD